MITRAWFASLLLATSLAAGTSMPPCDDASVESWIANMRERLLSFDLLGRHAVERFGTPTACHGEVNAEFDGMEFGRVRLEFSEGAVLQVETFPPESSRVALTVPGGFPDEYQARRLLRAYVEKIGAEVDWSEPEIATKGAATVETFRSADTGLNASAEVVSAGGRITTLRFSMAL